MKSLYSIALHSLGALSLTPVLLLMSCAGNPLPTDPFRDTAELFRLTRVADDAYQQGRWLDAARAYQNLTTFVPDDAYAWFKLGNTYTRQGDLDQAINAYQDALQRDSTEPRAWYNLATTYLLNARKALSLSGQHLHPDDPTLKRVNAQLEALDKVIYQKLENMESPSAGLPLASRVPAADTPAVR